MANRILLKPSFQDFDKSKCCHVTDQQFARVLKNLNIFPGNEQVFQLVLRKYFDKGNTREVNYFSFCADVDRPEDMFPGYVSKREGQAAPVGIEERKSQKGFYGAAASPTQTINVLENRFMQEAVNIANDPADVESRLQALVVMKRVRVEEFFRDFDKLRKGKVTIN